MIHHSGQRVQQYASDEYVTRLEEAGARISMAAVDDTYENARAGSFFGTLKMEKICLKDYRMLEETRKNVAQFMEEVLTTALSEQRALYRKQMYSIGGRT